MFRLATVCTLTSALMMTPVWAQDDAAKAEMLFDELGLYEMTEIMRDEGLAYGDTLAADMLPGGGSPQWDKAVAQIYDVETMTETALRNFTAALDGDDIDTMLAFFTSEPGRTIVELEVSARRALLDEAVEQASNENAALEAMDETPRYLLVQEFIEANNLIESNVEGALNSSYAFYMGLIDGGAMPPGVTAETALQDVWAQEADIRNNTTEWAYSFLLMAYQPLSDADLQTYIAFSKSEAGGDLTDALFTSFNGMFDDISHELGLASSQFMLTQEL